MQAIIHTEFGAPERVLRLQETAAPEAGPGEVLVRVKANALAKGDWLIAQGLPYIARPSFGLRRPKHPVAGLEFSGIVAEVGSEVTGLEPGVEVFGWGEGGLAEFVAVPRGQLVAKPARIGFEQAAAVPISGLAALQAVRDRGEVKAGDRVLVTGAGGGVGSFAVQIAKALGAEVTGVSSTRNVDLVRSLGADHVIDYTREEIDSGSGRFDVIIDIAGNRSLESLRRSLTPRGTLVIVGSTGGRWTMGFGRTVRAMLLSPFVRQRLRPLISTPNHDDLASLAALVEEGKVKPVVGATYPLDDAAAAVDRVGTGRISGKTVVTV
jgi:NADPH:quinone reductase-like Zn-dependent oxidoreductase